MKIINIYIIIYIKMININLYNINLINVFNI